MFQCLRGRPVGVCSSVFAATTNLSLIGEPPLLVTLFSSTALVLLSDFTGDFDAAVVLVLELDALGCGTKKMKKNNNKNK
jgi:hypothetical protein